MFLLSKNVKFPELTEELKQKETFWLCHLLDRGLPPLLALLLLPCRRLQYYAFALSLARQYASNAQDLFIDQTSLTANQIFTTWTAFRDGITQENLLQFSTIDFTQMFEANRNTYTVGPRILQFLKKVLLAFSIFNEMMKLVKGKSKTCIRYVFRFRQFTVIVSGCKDIGIFP